MGREQLLIRTSDGECRTFVFTAGGTGPWPAVILFMDGLGLRPVLMDMSRRLANAGFVVVLPDLFYRAGRYDPLDPAAVFATDDVRTTLEPLLSSTDNQRAARDAAAFLAYLDGRDDVSSPRIGTVGYCMGGAISLTVAATYPDRIAAAASFHGGSLATDSAHSPHLLTDQIDAAVYIGAADNDSSYPPEMAGHLCTALMAASVNFRHDLYVGAAHGWTMADFPVYDPAAAERHWTRLIGWLDEHLR